MIDKKSFLNQIWYHKIDLGNGVVTPGRDFEPVWDNIRAARRSIDYSEKRVLDIGSMEGMWAFEAEKLGASTVVATDCYCEGGFGSVLDKFLFCRSALNSSVIPCYNTSPYQLWDRLDTIIRGRIDEGSADCTLFDIVQHLGVLYHLRDPLLSLSQSRSMIKTGGLLLLETAAVANDDASCMHFNGVPPDEFRIYNDKTTWWAPTLPCLKEMARASLFEPMEGTLFTTTPYKQKNLWLCRTALVCKAVGQASFPPEYSDELASHYRNPGFSKERFPRVRL